MIHKVLIAEDHESANISVQKTVEELDIPEIHYAYYCDDAFAKIRNAKLSNVSYDLLITDLYFDQDNSKQQITDGTALIAAARQEQPELKVLVFSAENKPAVIEALYDKYKIDGYVRKARNDAKELKLALQSIEQNQLYQPRHLLQLIQQKNLHQFGDFDIAIISLLARGVRLKEMPAELVNRQIQPSGLSSIEKRLNHIKENLGCNTNEQLIAFCKDIGII